MRSSYTLVCDHHNNPRPHHYRCCSSLSQSKIGPGHLQKHSLGRSDEGYRNHHRPFCLRQSPLHHHRRSYVYLSFTSYSCLSFTFSSSLISSLGALLPLLPLLLQVLHLHLPLAPHPRSHLHLHLRPPPHNVSSSTSLALFCV